MITPNIHDKLIEFNINLLTAPVIGLTKIKLGFDSFKNIYPNKKLSILTDNSIVISGILIKNNFDYYLLLDTPLTTGTEYIHIGVYYETFEVSNDNENITFNDLYTKAISSEDVFVNDGLFSKGNSGLLDGFDKFKINRQKIEQTYGSGIDTINISSPVFTKIGNVNIPTYNNGKFNTFEHIFKISGKVFNCKIKINLTNFDDNFQNENNQFLITVLEFSTIEKYKNIQLVLNITRKFKTPDVNYLDIQAKFDTSKLPDFSEDLYLDNKIIHYVENKNQIFFTNVAGTTNVDLHFNTEKLNDTIYDTNFIINRNTLNYDINGVKNIFNEKIKILDNTDLNNFKQPGNYYNISGSSSIYNKPINNNLRFLLDVVNLNIDNNNFWLLQKYTTYQQFGNSTNYQIIIFERVSVTINNVFSWSPWIETGKKIHTHNAVDIIETSAKNFVSLAEKANWNSIFATTAIGNWKPTVVNEQELNTAYPSSVVGWSAYVINTNSIWSYNGIKWINQTPIVSETGNGLVSKEQYIENFLGSSISKKIPTGESYIHRLTVDPENIYGANYTHIKNNHTDRVKRTVQLSNQLKEYTLQEGWNIEYSGTNSIGFGKDTNSIYNNSIGLGENLLFSSENQIILGKFNLDSPDDGFVIGNGFLGTRSNLMSITKTGIFKASGYSIPNSTVNDILVANGTKISKSNLVAEVLQGVVQSSTEIINVASGNENYVLNWDSTLIGKFGKFGKFEVWLLNATNIYTKEDVPIKMVTEINSTTDELTALTYTFTLSSIECIILIN